MSHGRYPARARPPLPPRTHLVTSAGRGTLYRRGRTGPGVQGAKSTWSEGWFSLGRRTCMVHTGGQDMMHIMRGE